MSPLAYYVTYQLTTYGTAFTTAIGAGTAYTYVNNAAPPSGYTSLPAKSSTTTTTINLPPIADNDQFLILNVSYYQDDLRTSPIDLTNLSSTVSYTSLGAITFDGSVIQPRGTLLGPPISYSVAPFPSPDAGTNNNTLQYILYGNGSPFRVNKTLVITDTGGAAQVNTLNLLAPPPLPLTCFLGNAKVLTFDGYKRIDSLQKGDLVKIPQGYSPIKTVKIYDVKPSEETNPYIIPAGKYGALTELLISPQHCVKVGSEMIKAKDLGLEQKDMKSEFTYYNLELDKWYSMYVEGVEVETFAVPTKTFLSLDDYERVKHKCKGLDVKEFTNGVEVPLYQRC